MNYILHFKYKDRVYRLKIDAMDDVNDVRDKNKQTILWRPTLMRSAWLRRYIVMLVMSGDEVHVIFLTMGSVRGDQMMVQMQESKAV